MSLYLSTVPPLLPYAACCANAIAMLQKLLALAALPLLLAGCATPQSLSLESAQADPWEARNRRVYAFNKKLDRYVMMPVTNSYRAIVPVAGRRGISNAYNNYGEPFNFMNFILQGRPDLALQSVDRFLLNSTLGVAGLGEAATDLGRPVNDTDWGQTFSQWGIEAGPYVVLPFFGPSTLRDGIATPIDLIVDPADFVRNATLSPSIWWRAGQISLRVIDLRSSLVDSGAEGLLASSLDEYATVRSAWLQRRRARLYYGNPPLSAEELEDYEAETQESPKPVSPAP